MHAHVAVDDLVPAGTACYRINDIVHESSHVTLLIELGQCGPVMVFHGSSP